MGQRFENNRVRDWGLVVQGIKTLSPTRVDSFDLTYFGFN